MIQHLLLMLVAAPLVLLGARVKRFAPGRSGLIVCWLAGSVTIFFWHLPAIFALTQQSHPWHTISHAGFFIAGIVFWWPVVQPAWFTDWSIPIYLFLATLPCDVLSAYLAFCGHIVYQPYLFRHSTFGLSALDDQALAGALMWVTVTLGYLLPALVITAQLISNEHAHASARAF